ncbi:MAG: mannose-1-phosphate guanylyltransferase [Saprospiraceae bacterium]|nr:mannose-1-phosphate guanylyltransferase [Saprospiraceae bacterium]
MSTEALPKQFIDILGEGRSLLRATFERSLQLVPASQIWVVTHKKYAEIVQKDLPEINAEHILSEPQRKNTAPAIAFAAYSIEALDPEAIMIVLSSDHLIQREDALTRALQTAAEYADTTEGLFTLGIQPDCPHTGYGYIDKGEKIAETVFKVSRFVEKPDSNTAKAYLQSERYLWNAGVFIWKITALKKALMLFANELFLTFEAAAQRKVDQSQNPEWVIPVFDKCENISIDYAVLEAADNVFTIEADIGWSDLGTWGALYDYSEKNALGNVIFNRTVVQSDSTNCIVYLSTGKNAIIRGLDGYVVAETADGLLIYPLDQEQNIKNSLDELRKLKNL